MLNFLSKYINWPYRWGTYGLPCIVRKKLNYCSLDELCKTALQALTHQTRRADDFARAMLEAAQWRLIDEERFRRWFTAYVNQHQEDLLKTLVSEEENEDLQKALRLCRMFVSALALAKEDHDRLAVPPSINSSPAPPCSGPRRKQEYSGSSTVKKGPLVTPSKVMKKRKEPTKTRQSSSKHASVESAPESD